MAITYEEFLKLPESNSPIYEAINREVIKMDSPTSRHQFVLGRLTKIFGNFLEGKECQLCEQPFDVFLGEDVVVPDLFVVCNRDKIVKKGCVGSPDLIVEILSPSSTKRDLFIKRDLYQKNKVKEYWVVFPNDGHVIVHILDSDGVYYETEYSEEDTICPSIFPGLSVRLDIVFAERTDRKVIVEYFKTLLDS